MATPLLLLEYFPTLAPDYSYGVLPDHLKHISLPIDGLRKEGCDWYTNGVRCGIPWSSSCVYYCDEHKNIPDMKRYEPLTVCRKRR